MVKKFRFFCHLTLSCNSNTYKKLEDIRYLLNIFVTSNFTKFDVILKFQFPFFEKRR